MAHGALEGKPIVARLEGMNMNIVMVCGFIIIFVLLDAVD
jgi:hypothetical protein